MYLYLMLAIQILYIIKHEFYIVIILGNKISLLPPKYLETKIGVPVFLYLPFVKFSLLSSLLVFGFKNNFEVFKGYVQISRLYNIRARPV